MQQRNYTFKEDENGMNVVVCVETNEPIVRYSHPADAAEMVATMYRYEEVVQHGNKYYVELDLSERLRYRVYYAETKSLVYVSSDLGDVIEFLIEANSAFLPSMFKKQDCE